jgi:outer membrane protein assembly factor BamB
MVLAISAMLLLGLLAIPASAGSDWIQFQNGSDKNGVTSEAGPTTATSTWETYLGAGGWMGVDTVPVKKGDYTYTIVADGDLHKVSDSGYEVTTGNWPVELQSGGNAFQNSVAAANESAIFVITTGYGSAPTLYAIDVDNGNILWSDTVGTSAYQCSCPILYDKESDGDEMLYFGITRMGGGDPTNYTDDGTYYCYNAKTGSEVWNRTTLDNKGYYWAGACSVGNYIVYGNDAGNVTLALKSDGTPVGSYNISDEFGDNSEIRSTCVYYKDASNNRIYFTAKSGTCYYVGLDYNPRTQVYSFNPSVNASNANLSYSTSTPAIDITDGVVYVCAGTFSGGGGLYALSAGDLTEKWNHSGGGAQSSPVVSKDLVNNKNVIYYTTNEAQGTFFAIRDDGNACYELFNYTPTNDNYILQGVAVSGGKAFFGNDDGYLIGVY